MHKRYLQITDTVFLCVCVLIVSVIGICVYALPHESFSEDENRILSDFPRLSAQSLANGKFFEGLSEFYSDRIPFRKSMISIKAVCELASGKYQNNNVIFGKDGRLTDRCEYSSCDVLKSNLEKMSALYGDEKNVYAILPRSVDIYFGGEEAGGVSELVFSQIPSAEVLYGKLTSAAAAGEKVYYKTDHHLDADGVYILYENIMSGLGAEPYEKNSFSIQTVNSKFLGSTYSKAGLLPVSYDEISLYRYEGDDSFKVFCDDSGCDVNSLYRPNELDKKDKYKVFLGGNHGIIHVDAADGEERKKLLIIKDSFANAVIPLLARSFDLTVADPRYTKSLPVGDYDAVVFIFGADTLATGKIF